jgi:hypothetical protein
VVDGEIFLSGNEKLSERLEFAREKDFVILLYF